MASISKKLGKGAMQALASLSEPQRQMLQAIAERTGAKPEDESSEAASRAIVEQIAAKLGLPESELTNAAKALGVAGLEVFADPLGPIGKLGKGGKAAKALGMAGKADDAKKAEALARLSKGLKKRDEFENVAKATKALPEAEARAKLAETLKKQKDTGTFKETLNKDTHTLTSSEEFAKMQDKASAPRFKERTYDAGAMKKQMREAKPTGPDLDFEEIKKAMIKKNRGQ